MSCLLTSMFLAITLLSPAIFPPGVLAWHVPAILGCLAIVAALPNIKEARLLATPDTYFALGLLAFVALSIVVAMGWIGGAVDALGLFTPTLSSFFLVLLSCRTYKRMQFLVGTLFIVAMFIFLSGLTAFISGNVDSLYLLNEHEVYRFRGLGVIADPNDFALFMVMLIPLMWLRWKKANLLSNVFLSVLPTVFLMIAIYFTHSRGGAIAFAVVVLYGFRRKLGNIKSIIFTGCILTALLALQITGGRGMADDDGARIGLWRQALTAFKAHPLFGVGMGQMNDYTDTNQTAHNSYVLCIGELGVIGAYFWYGLLVSSWMGLRRIGYSSRTTSETDSSFEKRLESRFTGGHGGQAASWLGTALLDGPVVPLRFATPTSFSSRPPITPQNLLLTGEADAFSAVPEKEDIRILYTAHLTRTAFVGVLVGCFFLSRTYSIILYILIGFCGALRAMYLTQTSVKTIGVGRIMKWTTIVTLSSIILLYSLLQFLSLLGLG